MFQGLKNGWHVINASIHAFFKFPILLVPLLIVWMLYAPAVIYFEWHFNWDSFSAPQTAFIVFLIIWGFALMLTLSCSVLLELIQQKETGKPFSLFKSLGDTLTKNILHILILSFIWATLWFILSILDSLFRKIKSSGFKKESVENVARKLAGSEDVSFSSLTFDALKKGIRMIVFLVMPAFAWEELGVGNSFRRGLAVLRQRISEFVAGYTLSYLASIIVFLPPGIMFILSDDLKIEFPDWIWSVCILYIAFAWSYTIYLEQMFIAELYLWQLVWEREVRKAETAGMVPPKFNEVRRPSIVDDIADLNDTGQIYFVAAKNTAGTNPAEHRRPFAHLRPKGKSLVEKVPKNYYDQVRMLFVLIKTEKDRLLGPSNENEIVNALHELCKSEKESEHLLRVYKELFNTDLIEDLIKTSSSYERIKAMVGPFVTFGLVEDRFPHSRSSAAAFHNAGGIQK